MACTEKIEETLARSLGVGHALVGVEHPYRRSGFNALLGSGSLLCLCPSHMCWMFPLMCVRSDELRMVSAEV